MAELRGTLVASAITPSHENDLYATHHAKYGRGGYRSVATLAERDAITEPRRSEGMLVHVREGNQIYQLVGGVENIHWTILELGNSDTTEYVAGATVHSTRVVRIDEFGLVVEADPEYALTTIGISTHAASAGSIS